MTLADLDPATACDLAYVQLVDWATGMDHAYYSAQLAAGVEDVDPHPHRDDLDDQLATPIGREGLAMTRLTEYLKG